MTILTKQETDEIGGAFFLSASIAAKNAYFSSVKTSHHAQSKLIAEQAERINELESVLDLDALGYAADKT